MTKLDSEFTCEVVEVVEILPHGNADKLEVARFKFADGTIPEYQVVVSKGDFKPGSWGVYVSDDSLAPVDKPQFEFLKKRLDYIPFKYCTHLRKMDGPRCGCVDLYRVKAAKIRGVLSTGMMLHFEELPSDFKRNAGVGTDCSAILGVVRYVRPEDVVVEHETGVERKTGNWLKRWWRGWLRGNIKLPDYSVLSLRKSPHLFDDDSEVFVTEKIHGSNIRFGMVAGRPVVGSHHTIKTDNRPWWKKRLAPKKTGNWYGTDVFSEWFFRVFPSKEYWRDFPNNIVFYGELYGENIQKLSYGAVKTRVAVFDAWDVKAKRWLSYDEMLDVLPWNISTPPILFKGHATLDDIKALSRGNTTVNTTAKHIREGVVVRSMDWQKRGKWVSEDYLAIKDR